MLAARVRPIPATQVSTVSGISVPLHFNCHQATCYWLYTELTGQPPMGWAFADSNLQNTTELMSKLALHGRIAEQATIGGLPNGTVLVFTTPLDVAKHSCIIDDNGSIGGYNQQSWFTSAGTPNQFSTHAIGDIRWRRGKRSKVLLSDGGRGRLYYIPEATAIQFAKFNF